MTKLRAADGGYLALDTSVGHVPILMDLGWQPHPADRAAWWTRSPYLAAPLWDWVDGDETRRLLGPYAWNYQTSFALAPIPGTAVDRVRLPAGETPYPFQIAGIQRATLQKRILLGDDMGVGKSVQALGVINLTKPARTVIGCPTFLAENWARECERWLVDPQPITMLNGAKKSMPDKGIIILPYSRGHSFAKAIVAGPKIDYCILDEHHYVKSSTARRTQPWLAEGGIARVADRVAMLSGTPMPNNSVELYEPLKTLAPQLLGGLTREGFQELYSTTVKLEKKVADRVIPFTKTTTKSASVLNAELRASGVMVRRLKKDVLPQLPPKNQYFVHMTPSSEIADLVREESDLYEQLATRIMTSQELIALRGHVEAVRSRLGLLKAPKIAEYVRWLFQTEERVVLGMLHLEAIEEVRRQFDHSGVKVHVLTGAQSVRQRQASVDEFQKTRGGRMLLDCQITAAGEGLTMTAARYAVLGEIAWTPGKNDQFADRIHRISQTRQVEIPILTFPHAVEQRVIRANAEKAIGAKKVLDVNLSVMLQEAASAA